VPPGTTRSIIVVEDNARPALVTGDYLLSCIGTRDDTRPRRKQNEFRLLFHSQPTSIEEQPLERQEFIVSQAFR
jgi:hypothetical protein